MTTIVAPVTAEKTTSPADVQKGIENHKKAAKHLEEAAKHHKEAAKHHEAGSHEKACESTVKAHGHTCLASEAQRDVLKQHALKS
ncbi:MAG: hypothetical protein ACLQQ4_06740 [Bacteroidia bacterium]